MRFTAHAFRVWVAGLTLGLASGAAHAQRPMNRDEKLAQKIRLAYLKAAGDIRVATLSADSLKAHADDTGYVLIDVRTDAEIAVSQIPRAIALPDFAAKYRVGGPPKGAVLVTYCTVGYRSGKVAEQLAAQGYLVRNLEGGLLAWIQVGGTVVRRGPGGIMQTTTEVHVYDKEWNLLPPGYQAKW